MPARQPLLATPALVKSQGAVQAVYSLVVPGMPPAAQYLEQFVEAIGRVAFHGFLKLGDDFIVAMRIRPVTI
jgi:hypothetical protein